MTGGGETADDSASPRPSLRERKAFETRRRILAAALDIMAREGLDAVTVGDLADRADVAVGTFYNYFRSREAVVDDVIDLEIGTMGLRLDALIAGIPDPANAFAAALRHVIRTALHDTVWGWLVVRLGIEHDESLQAIRERLEHVIALGVESGRFLVTDVPTAGAMTLGALLGATRVYLETERSAREAASSFAEAQLRSLGVSSEESARIAVRVLPELPVIADQGALSISRVPL